MSTFLYVEGGGGSKDLQTRCREGFRRLLEKCGFSGRMPRIVACGSRNDTYRSFRVEHDEHACDGFVAMLVDSEEPVENIEKPWSHLAKRDGWQIPNGAHDEQAMLMTTCMETWVASDRAALQSHYGSKLQETALPPLVNMESRDRHEVQNALVSATRACKNAYQKGRRSYEVLTKLDPAVLASLLPSFVRLRRTLDERL